MSLMKRKPLLFRIVGRAYFRFHCKKNLNLLVEMTKLPDRE